MGFIDDIKAKSDINGDGKISKEDLESLGNDKPEYKEQIDALKAKADANDDGKVDLSDAQALFDDAKDAIGNIFGGNN